MPKPGWLDRQFKKASEDVKNWPDWMRREAGLDRFENDTSSGAMPMSQDATKDTERDDRDDRVFD